MKVVSTIQGDFNKARFILLKDLYKKAIDDNKISFMFLGNEILIKYAKYLIEYLEPKFK